MMGSRSSRCSRSCSCSGSSAAMASSSSLCCSIASSCSRTCCCCSEATSSKIPPRCSVVAPCLEDPGVGVTGLLWVVTGDALQTCFVGDWIGDLDLSDLCLVMRGGRTLFRLGVYSRPVLDIHLGSVFQLGVQ